MIPQRARAMTRERITIRPVFFFMKITSFMMNDQMERIDQFVKLRIVYYRSSNLSCGFYEKKTKEFLKLEI